MILLIKAKNAERKEGYGAVTPVEHFELALLYMQTGRYKVVKKGGTTFYEIPSWSDFSEKSILALENSKELKNEQST